MDSSQKNNNLQKRGFLENFQNSLKFSGTVHSEKANVKLINKPKERKANSFMGSKTSQRAKMSKTYKNLVLLFVMAFAEFQLNLKKPIFLNSFNFINLSNVLGVFNFRTDRSKHSQFI